MNLLTIIVNNRFWKLLSSNQVSQRSPHQQPERNWGFTFYGETPNGLKDSLKNLNSENPTNPISVHPSQQESNQATENGLASFPLAMLHPQRDAILLRNADAIAGKDFLSGDSQAK